MTKVSGLVPSAALALLQGAAPAGASGAVDSAAVAPPPLPGGLTTIMRFIFNLPSWVQVTAVSVALVLAVALLWLLWRRRAPIGGWLKARTPETKAALVGVGVFVLAGAATLGRAGWNYSMHDNNFCVSCHIMTPAFQRFELSQHRNLECHACHRQSIFVSMAQLYYWVADRPAEVPRHAKVPTKICTECHTSEPGALERHGGPNAAKPVKLDREPGDTMWKHVLQTAGHSVHMRHDEPKLKEIACVTCHGAEVHKFSPVSETCGQANCHDDIDIQLGKMAGQTSEHCTGCHQFKVAVAANVSPDSARTGLVPHSQQCFSCHQMKEKLVDFDVAADKHEGKCGACHDPHKQKKPSDAFATCQSGGCHQRVDTVTAFHRGIGVDALANCASCHEAHTWKVPSTECKACHVNPDVPLPRRGVHPQFRTAAAGTKPVAVAPAPARPVTLVAEPVRAPRGPMIDDTPAWLPDDTMPPRSVPTEPARAPRADSARFSHAKHRSLACTSCHGSERSHGELLVRSRDACAACHHSPSQKAECKRCHDERQLRTQLALTVPVKTSVAATVTSRELPFRHEVHAKSECKACHGAGPALAFDRGCASCHDDHHVAKRDCVTCHANTPRIAAHTKDRVHQGCAGSGCHQDASVAALPATRNVCISCHTRRADHKPGRDCGTCHLVRWSAASQAGGGSGGGGGMPQ